MKTNNELIAEFENLKHAVYRNDATNYQRSLAIREFNMLLEKLTIAEMEIEKLAKFIMNDINNEPSESESAVDCAIRIINEKK